MKIILPCRAKKNAAKPRTIPRMSAWSLRNLKHNKDRKICFSNFSQKLFSFFLHKMLRFTETFSLWIPPPADKKRHQISKIFASCVGVGSLKDCQKQVKTVRAELSEHSGILHRKRKNGQQGNSGKIKPQYPLGDLHENAATKIKNSVSLHADNVGRTSLPVLITTVSQTSQL